MVKNALPAKVPTYPPLTPAAKEAMKRSSLGKKFVEHKEGTLVKVSYGR